MNSENKIIRGDSRSTDLDTISLTIFLLPMGLLLNYQVAAANDEQEQSKIKT